MNNQVMMYVHFDNSGEIKSISPVADIAVDGINIRPFPLSSVEDFLTAKKNTSNYFIKITNRIDDAIYTITRKPSLEVNYRRNMSNFLTEIELAHNKDAFLLIENCINDKKINIVLNPMVNFLIKQGTETEQLAITNFINTPSTSLFFTKKGDPYYLVYSVSFLPKILLEKGSLSFSYNMDLINTSLFTCKLVDGYNYSIK